jgi:hypothetical protein
MTQVSHAQTAWHPCVWGDLKCLLKQMLMTKARDTECLYARFNPGAAVSVNTHLRRRHSLSDASHHPPVVGQANNAQSPTQEWPKLRHGT